MQSKQRALQSIVSSSGLIQKKKLACNMNFVNIAFGDNQSDTPEPPGESSKTRTHDSNIPKFISNKYNKKQQVASLEKEAAY